MNKYQIHTFPNGIRLIHQQVPNTKIAHCGFMLDIGSRNELPEEVGIAHFWEHMAFKGTSKRKAFHIINRLEVVGGDLNAYTTKEKICFHASLLDSHFEKAVDLLTDITFHSTFPEKEINKEKGVILEEMSMYEDDPADAIQDEFDSVTFGSHSLGQNILGTRESVRGFTKDDFHKFINRNLNTERVIFSSVSSLPFKTVLRICKKYFTSIPTFSAKPTRIPFTHYESKIIEQVKPTNQTHCVLGGLAYSTHDDRKQSFSMLNNLLGGPGMNSRLNLSVREKYGYVYSIESGFNTFSDVGQFSIQFATEPKTFQKSLNLVKRELEKLKNKSLGTLQLHTAKQQMMGQLAMAEESNLGLMLMFAKTLLDYGQVLEVETIFRRIEAITATQILEVANDIFVEHKLSQLVYSGEEN
jgi:predicted Zn-dependent peptidase